MKHERRIAKIENDFIFKAHYALSAVEQKIVLFLASRIDPAKDKEFVKQVVPIKSIEKTLWDGNSFGNPYAYLQDVVTTLLDRKITFPKGTIINGERLLAGGINWFQSIVVKDSPEGVAIEFMFSERMKPFLLQLNKYVRINAMEVMDMRGKYAIRMYQVFKAERERTRQFIKHSRKEYGIEELRGVLGIGEKYKRFDKFKSRVLEPMKAEINTHSNEISIDYELFRGHRNKVTGVGFTIRDKKKIEQPKRSELEDYKPTPEDVDSLPHAQRKAYQQLVEFGVIPGIAYRQILPRIKGEIFEGYEDYFVELAIEHFSKKTKSKNKAGAFVKWWCEVESFDSLKGKDWGKIADATTARKKKLQITKPEAYENREAAKGMSYTEFVKWHKEQNQEAEATPEG